MSLSAFRNRLQVQHGLRDAINEVLNGEIPFWWNGSCVQFELGIFRRDELADLNGIVELRIEIKEISNLNGPALMTETILGDNIKTALTLDQWNSDLETECHALVFFGAELTNLDLGGSPKKKFWLVITAKRTDGQPITLGCSEVEVAEDGSSVGPSAPASGRFRYSGGLPESKFEDNTWHRWKPSVDEGQYLIDFEQVASDEVADGDFSKTRFSDGYMELLFPDATWHRIAPLLDQGQYLLDVRQEASDSFTQNSEKFRLRLGHVEFQFPDDSWHRIKPALNEEQYLFDIEQTASV